MVPTRYRCTIERPNPRWIILTGPRGERRLAKTERLVGKLTPIRLLSPKATFGCFTRDTLDAFLTVSLPCSDQDTVPDQAAETAEIVARVKEQLAPPRKTWDEVEAELNTYDT